MFEIDKQQFGAFVAQLRKEKELTQKEVAQRLFVSDKAVSKWETGSSMPDITLLIPLAELLDVSVVELLECRRAENPGSMDAPQADELVKKVIQLSERSRRELRRQWAIRFILSFVLSGGELALLSFVGYTLSDLFARFALLILLPFGFGIYFCFFVPDRLPVYYDQNRISLYVHGPVRMNLPGIYMNNRNWPHMVRVLRCWCVASMIGHPLLFILLAGFLPDAVISSSLLILLLGSLFIPLYTVGKKYE